MKAYRACKLIKSHVSGHMAPYVSVAWNDLGGIAGVVWVLCAARLASGVESL